MSETSTIILGIDPGTRVCGYGVIRIQHHSFIPLDYGCIRPPADFKLSDRYLIIYNSMEELIEKYQPDAVVFELQFVSKNAQSALKLGMARLSATLPAKKKGLPVFGYSPTAVKKAVVGNGGASKYQVQGMIQRLLNLSVSPPHDAADALALAICHAHTPLHVRARNEM